MGRIERRHAKEFARAFAVARGDDRGVDVDEIPLLEKLVDREGQPAADAKHGAKEIRARTQVRDFPHEFEGMPFFLERVGGIGLAEHGESRRDYLPLLSLALGWYEFALDAD